MFRECPKGIYYKPGVGLHDGITTVNKDLQAIPLDMYAIYKESTKHQ